MKTASDIDRLARQAMAAKKDEGVDLLKQGFPFRPWGWNIVIEPLKPKTVTAGGIEVPSVSSEAEAFQITCGRILKVGMTALQGVTSSGIKLGDLYPDCKGPDDLIGKFVIYQLHTGMELRFRDIDRVIKVMKTTDILGDTDAPDAWRFYV